MQDKSMIIIGAGIAGLPAGAMTGRDVISRICKQDQRKFTPYKAGASPYKAGASTSKA